MSHRRVNKSWPDPTITQSKMSCVTSLCSGPHRNCSYSCLSACPRTRTSRELQMAESGFSTICGHSYLEWAPGKHTHKGVCAVSSPALIPQCKHYLLDQSLDRLLPALSTQDIHKAHTPLLGSVFEAIVLLSPNPGTSR